MKDLLLCWIRELLILRWPFSVLKLVKHYASGTKAKGLPRVNLFLLNPFLQHRFTSGVVLTCSL